MNTYLRFGLTLLLVPLVLMLNTCKKDNVIPSYIHIDSINVVGNTAVFGSTSHKITDAWVYFEDGNLQGVYELPCTFPIRASGTIKLRIIAGIKVNGVAATRVIYPFYTDTLMTLNLVPSKTDTIAPQVSYFPSTQFGLGPLDFETGNPFTGMQYITDPAFVFQGHTSAKLITSDSMQQDFAYTATSFTIPPHTAAAFLEMDYKNDIQFTASLNVGVNGYNDSIFDLVTMTPQANWNKIYINLTPTVNQTQGDAYRLIFYENKVNLTDKPNIYFDNIKVLYFPQ